MTQQARSLVTDRSFGNAEPSKGDHLMNYRFLPQSIHGILDYAVAVTLIAAPFILDFKGESAFAHWLSVAAGAGLFAYSLLTDYSVGALSAIPFKAHLALDAAAGALFVVLAVVAGFETVTAAFYGVVGAAVLAVVAVTKLDATDEATLSPSLG